MSNHQAPEGVVNPTMISSSSKYALRALTFLAEANSSDFISIEHLAKSTEVTQPYLAKVIKALSREGLLETKKGVKGGARFCLDKKTISFLEVCEALDDPLVRSSCLLSKKKCGPKHCAVHDCWNETRKELFRFLTNEKIQRRRPK